MKLSDLPVDNRPPADVVKNRGPYKPYKPGEVGPDDEPATSNASNHEDS